MGWFKVGLCVLAVVFLAGCAGSRQVGLRSVSSDASSSICRWDGENAEASREIAKCLLRSWRLNSGFIRGALGSRIDNLPSEVVKGMDYLDDLALKEIETLDDMELGRSLGVRVLMVGELVLAAIRKFAPDIFNFVVGLLVF